MDFRNNSRPETLKVYSFRGGLPLFHITRKNLPINWEDNEYLQSLPYGKSVYDMTKPMYFSLDELHTIYYDNWDSSSNQWASTHLAGETTKIIKLAYLGKRKSIWGDLENLVRFLMVSGIDGWIAYDDEHDRWREIYLFNPIDKMVFTRELDHLNYDQNKFNESNGRIYPQEAADREQLSLNVHAIASSRLKELIVQDGI